MAHLESKQFIEIVKKKYPKFFRDCKVLDVGSYDCHNGNRWTNEVFFKSCQYTGIDISDGLNVDIVCPVHEWKDKRKFDTIISTSTFEHDYNWNLSLISIVKRLKKGGLLVFTCGTTGRGVHGVKYKGDIQGNTNLDEARANYFKNLTQEDLESIGLLRILKIGQLQLMMYMICSFTG